MRESNSLSMIDRNGAGRRLLDQEKPYYRASQEMLLYIGLYRRIDSAMSQFPAANSTSILSHTYFKLSALSHRSDRCREEVIVSRPWLCSKEPDSTQRKWRLKRRLVIVARLPPE